MTHHNIVERQYSTEEYLRIRQETHDKYTVPNLSYSEWALHLLPWKGDERVLDVGCGNGIYYTRLRHQHPNIQYFGVDLFDQMIEAHPSPVNLAQSDMMALPFPDHSFDVVMANHVLFLMEDVTTSIQELRRVLKPDGILMTTTNSSNNMPELQVLMRRAIVLLSRSGGNGNRPQVTLGDSFSLESGTRLLSRHFYAVVRHDLPSALVFQQTEPAMAYLESTRDLREDSLPEDVEWDDVMVIMRQQINQLVKHLGELVINKQNGVLIASEQGGFIREFLSRNK